MFRAGAKLAARLDLAALANVTSKAPDILVVHVVDVIGAELADLAARTKSSASTAARATSAAATEGATPAGLATLALALRAAKA